MNIIEETYLSVLENLSFSVEKFSKNIINESVYAYEELKPLIDDIHAKIISNKHCKLNANEVLSLLGLNKKKLRKFNADTTLYVCFAKYLNDLNILNDLQINDISKRLKNDEGVLVSDFSRKNEYLIVIRNFFNANSTYMVLYHELIHFLQNSTGMKMHEILKHKDNVSDEDAVKISETLEMNFDVVKNSFEYFYQRSEFEAFIANIFLELKEFFDENGIDFSREVLYEILNSFNCKGVNDFDDYFFNVNRNLISINFKFNRLYTLKFFKLLHIYGYFKKGFLSIKTHLFGYFDKSLKNK